MVVHTFTIGLISFSILSSILVIYLFKFRNGRIILTDIEEFPEDFEDDFPPINSVHNQPNNNGTLSKKAYVISIYRIIHKDLSRAIRLVGFEPKLASAFVPTSHYSDINTIADYCLGHNRPINKTTDLSRGEYALICSHRLVWDLIANDNNLGEDDWSLVFEDDARIVPAALEENPKDMVDDILYRSKAYLYGFVYLGLCGDSRCTHAYAVTKSFATTFFNRIYCTNSEKSKLKCNVLQTDAAFEKYFFKDRPDPPVLIGRDFHSPEAGTHLGLFYQQREESYNEDNNGIGTSLLIDRDFTVNEKHCYRHDWTGRLGNLMFQYASLLGLCFKHGYPLHSCIAIQNHTIDEVFLPIHKFTQTFRIPIVTCKSSNFSYTEHQESVYDIRFDPKLMEQRGHTIINGYMQSYKYFHPHAKVIIKRTFSFQRPIKSVGAEVVGNIRKQLSRKHSVVCVSVRRGDKVNNLFYNQWALSVNYFIKAIEHALSTKNDSALLFFVGGGVNENDRKEDHIWVEKNIASRFQASHRVYMESPQSSDVESMFTMSLCDAIILGSSTYSWWAAYLSDIAKLVIVPGSIQEGFIADDYYLPEWFVIDQNSAS